MSERISLNDARKAKTKAPDVFAPLVGEIAVGLVRLGEDNFGLKVNLSQAPETDIPLPTDIDGVPIQIEVVGKILRR